MKNFEQSLIARRMDFMIAHTDIDWLSISCHMGFAGDSTDLLWSVSCSVKKDELLPDRDDGAFKTVRGEMEHIHGCRDLGWALEEVYRRAAWNLSTGNVQ